MVRTDRLGDVVLSFPVVELLRAHAPSARIHMLVHPRNAPLARLQRNVERVITDPGEGPGGMPALVRLLRVPAYDVIVHLFPRPRLALAARLAGIPTRVGTRSRYYSFLFNRRVAQHRSRSNLHERDLNAQLLEALSVPIVPVGSGIEVPAAARRKVRELLTAAGPHPVDPFLVLHPGSGGSSLAWPATRFGRLARRMIGEGVPVAVTGTEQDGQAVRETLREAGPGAIDLSGRLGLVELAALLAEARMIVTNSTGPLHLADAVGSRALGLFSPVRCALPERWGPYSQPENVLLPPRPVCDRCRTATCREGNCMASIPVEEVFARTLDIWRGEEQPARRT